MGAPTIVFTLPDGRLAVVNGSAMELTIAVPAFVGWSADSAAKMLRTMADMIDEAARKVTPIDAEMDP